jgi:hypothetical protein
LPQCLNFFRTGHRKRYGSRQRRKQRNEGGPHRIIFLTLGLVVTGVAIDDWQDADLIAHAARTRRLGAGSIIGSGTVSNKDGDGPGKPVEQGGAGYTCLAEVRTVETILEGKPKTPFLKFGDRVRIEMTDVADRSIFGAIDQEVVRYAKA